MKKVIDMCPFMGLKYEEDGIEIPRGIGLSGAENERLDSYFAKFYGQSFNRERAIELAQMALDNIPIPEDWSPV